MTSWISSFMMAGIRRVPAVLKVRLVVLKVRPERLPGREALKRPGNDPARPGVRRILKAPGSRLSNLPVKAVLNTPGNHHDCLPARAV
jgi:hypothetical protein